VSEAEAPVAARVERVLGGDVRAAGRLMRDLDDVVPQAIDALRLLYPHTGRARVVGITGNPGSGKSTLVSALVRHLRASGHRVGVVAIDPTSPFSGGAILGDRVRMQEHATDPGVFIRSLATRGHLGGLSRSTADVSAVLDAMGYDIVLIETVGVGQDEVDIVRAAHTVVVVMVPGLGDEVQAIKAGILEVADVFAVNKADRPGADRTERDLELMIHGMREGDWRPPIVRTVAISGGGVAALWDAVAKHAAEGALSGGGGTYEERARRRAEQRILDVLRDRVLARVDVDLRKTGKLDGLVERLLARTSDPYTLADEALASTLAGAR
jgi:LAO/AO transport system kinase